MGAEARYELPEKSEFLIKLQESVEGTEGRGGGCALPDRMRTGSLCLAVRGMVSNTA